MLRYFCCESRRRAAVVAAGLNGIDYLEVVEPAPGQPRDHLRVVFLAPPVGLAPADFQLSGGDVPRRIDVQAILPGAVPEEQILQLSRAGDCGKHFLRLVRPNGDPPGGFDPILSSVELWFWPEENGALACLPTSPPSPAPAAPPELDYLARDFSGLRTLMLDRLRTLVPGTRWGHPAELSTALVELMAHVGDRISYAQDAVATEAYLETARQRVSVRRHARLVGYRMHEGCNARTWVQLLVAPGTLLQTPPGGPPVVPAGTVVLAAQDGLPGRIVPGSADERRSQELGLLAFATLHPLRALDANLQAAPLYTWGADDCRLPAGATRATLSGHFPGLAPGDVLVLAEVRGRQSGLMADADPTRRWAVRLTAVRAAQDPAGGPLLTPPQAGPVPVTQIEWAVQDALPFPMTISTRVGRNQVQGGVSVALGNIALADHGAPVPAEPCGTVEALPEFLVARTGGACGCDSTEAQPRAARFNPILGHGPLTWSAPYDEGGPASQALASDPRTTTPEVRLEAWSGPLPVGGGRPALGSPDAVWDARADLLGAGAEDRFFVVEVDNHSQARLRFGDDRSGRRPEVGTSFFASYRVGNGPEGNVGAGTLSHVVSDQPAILGATNPLPAAGGLRPESMQEVRVAAPVAFRQQERAVTLADYARVAGQHPQVQRAAATWRWTGSWRTIYLAVDRMDGRSVDAAFEAELLAYLEPYRTMGHDLELEGPRFVDVDVAVAVCVDPTYFRAQVRAALEAVLSSDRLADGSLGLFHPDRYTFAQPILLSEIYAAAHRVPGVLAVNVTRFERLGDPSSSGLDAGRLAMQSLEIPRLEVGTQVRGAHHGRFELTLEGGR